MKSDLPRLSTISSLFRIFLHLREDINVSFGSVSLNDPLKFEKTLVIFKIKDDVIKAHWDKIGGTFGEDLSQESILFLENYVWISNIKVIVIVIENLKKENLITKTPLEGLSLSDLKFENCILIPRNNLSCIRLNLRDISSIFENEINITNFKFLSLNTKIVIKLGSMKDLAELNKLKEYFPVHSELEISYSPTKIKFLSIDLTK